MPSSTLAGRRVLELGGYLAAPYACNLLGGLGADVIKVESFEGDPTRKMVNGGPGGTFIAYSHGKRSICLDLAAEAGHAVFRRLLAASDIVVHNLSPGSTRKLKVAEADCRRENPQIVYCHITGYGPGPRENEVASNPIVEAATGVMAAHVVDGRPTRLGPSYHDMFAGSNAVIGILAELLGRTGGLPAAGIGVGLYETALHVAARDLVLAPPAGQGGPVQGEFTHPGYGAYKTADGRWMYLLMLSDGHWSKFGAALQLAAARDPELATLAQRRAAVPRVEGIVRTAVAGLTYADLSARLLAAGVGFTEVRHPAHVLEDPQARAPGKVLDVRFLGTSYAVPPYPVGGPVPSDALRSDPPLLGEHTFEIMAGLGYSSAECATLAAQRVIRGPAAAHDRAGS